jgi:serine/threonine protein kinase/WD40 repeat protein
MHEETLHNEEYTPSFDLPPPPRGEKPSVSRKPVETSPQSSSPVGYEIIEEVGRGGMAVVYRARQLSLQRPVALKMLLGAGHLGPDDLIRFRTEADAVARLQHSHIVQIHEVGDWDNRPFLSLEFVDGGTLAQYLHGVPQSPTDSATLVESLARTMGFAHRQGIVHRDLKPSNILLQGGEATTTKPGQPAALASFVAKISDFGLAKRLDADDSRTRTGVIIGTPSYMAPEQAKGSHRSVGPAVDIYALGAILYELLTGRPPFRGETPIDTLQYVLTQEPVPPSRLQPGVPRDLETICLKCLQKEPARRYLRADDLADDLRRYLQGETIQARPASVIERLVKWSRRRPTAAALLALSVLATAVLLIGGLKYNRDLGQAVINIKTERDKAVVAEKQTQRINLDFQREAGLNAAARGQSALASLWFAHAARQGAEDPDTSIPNRVRAKYWGRLAPTPTHVSPRMMPHVRRFVFHPAGGYLGLVSLPITQGMWAGVWDLTRNELLTLPVPGERLADLAWSPDGETLALGMQHTPERGELVVLNFPELKELSRLEVPGSVFTVAYSPDGQQLAVAFGKSVQIFEVTQRALGGKPWPHPHVVLQLAWTPDSQFLATACADGMARVFKANAGGAEPIYPAMPHVSVTGEMPLVSAPLIVQQGRSLVTVSSRTELVLRDLGTGKVQQTLTVTPMNSVAVSPEGTHIAIGGNRQIDLWDVTTRRRRRLPSEHRNTVLAAAFSPEGSTLVTASGDRTLSFWDVAEGKLLQPTISQLNEVTQLAFSPDGSALVLRQREGLVRLLNLARDVVPTRSVSVGGRNTFVAVDPPGQHFIPVGCHLTSGILHPRVYRVKTGEPAGPELETRGFVNGGTFSPNGRHVVLCGGDAQIAGERNWDRYRPDQQPGWIGIWDWTTGKLLAPLLTTTSEPLGVAYHPRGELLIAACASGEVLALDIQGSVKHRLQHGASTGVLTLTRGWVSFSPDGTRFVTSGLGNSAVLWDTAKLAPVGRLEHRNNVSSAAFSPDGRYVVTTGKDAGGQDNTARVWHADSGKSAAPPLMHPDWVFSAAFSPDGRSIVTSCRDHSAKLWDWQRGEHVALEHDDEVFDAAFTRDGRWVITASRDRTGASGTRPGRCARGSRCAALDTRSR